MVGYKEGYPGIYQILNKVTNKCYIGSGINIGNRWSNHKTLLKDGVHHSSKLQRSWNKHKKKNFVFTVLEKCPIELLTSQEQFYIDLYDSYDNGYNEQPIARSALGSKRNKECKRKLSAAQLRICKDPEEIKRRSARAKKQHREKNFGRHTWKSDHSIKMGKIARRTLKKLWKNPKYRSKMKKAVSASNKLRFKKAEG